LGIFSFKKKDEQPAEPQPGSGQATAGGEEAKSAPQFSPEKAQNFFMHARTKQETGAYEYAMSLWLRGLKFDPSSMSATEAFFQSAAGFLTETGGKKSVDKDLVKDISGKSDVDRYVWSLLEWGQKPTDPGHAVVAAEYAAKLGLAEPTYWIGERALPICMRDKKPRKDYFVKLMNALARVGAFEMSVKAGEAACRLDPSDGPLATEVRNMAAKATMSRGGFDKAGQQGGFMANVRNLDKQKQLEEAERIVKSEDTVERLLQTAEEDYKRRPDDPSAVNVYIKRLVERGTPPDESRAIEVATQAFETLKQFRFRQTAGEVRIRQARRKLGEMKKQVEANPGDGALKAQFDKAASELIDLELEEFKLCAEAYPTDQRFKFEVGRRYLHKGMYEDAIAFFQESQNDAKLRSLSLNYLAQSFLKIDYVDESIETFRRAMEQRDLPNDQQMELKYGLMSALLTKGEKDRDLAAAEEAEKLASSIAVVQINYKDIRARREALKKLIIELKNK
jgi:tetratricopeptide (TPR) repeat protein